MPEIDWTASMEQTFSFYKVNPLTWSDGDRITTIRNCTITRDREDDTLSYASIDGENLEGEYYVRVYMEIDQNHYHYREPLGTFLLQVNSSDFDGKAQSVSIDAYSPLIELKEKQPPIGFSLKKDDLIMDNAIRLAQENARAPSTQEQISKKKIESSSGFVAETDETWLSYLSALAANADYEFDITPEGRILYSVKQDINALQAVWIYTDDNSSILYPEIQVNRDLYGIPNVVEVLYSTSAFSYMATIENNDPNSPISIQNRGRRILYRETNPDAIALVTKEELDRYAENLLRSLSSVEYTISYTHGYCPVRISDCVLLNYKRAGIQNVRAKVIRQSIKCEPGCPVSEKATYTMKLWG